jgi:catechol 2,3-dioxygenase-like lactoylglutathione lyase family enzyme
MNFRGLDHIGFAVSDLDRSVEWYTFFLGDPPVLRKVWDVPYLSRIVGYPGSRLDCAMWRLPGGPLL